MDLRRAVAWITSEDAVTAFVVLGLVGCFVGLFAIFGLEGVAFAVCVLVVIGVGIRVLVVARRPKRRGPPVEHTLLVEEEQDLGESTDASSSEPIKPR